MTDDTRQRTHVLKRRRGYNALLRIAHSSYLKLPEDYYYPHLGMWTPPKKGELFDYNHQYSLVLLTPTNENNVQLASNRRVAVIREAIKTTLDSIDNMTLKPFDYDEEESIQDNSIEDCLCFTTIDNSTVDNWPELSIDNIQH